MGGISIWQLLIIAVIVILLFGTKKLRGLGSDLGSAVKGFKKAITDENENKEETPQEIKTESLADAKNTASSQAKDSVKENNQA